MTMAKETVRVVVNGTAYERSVEPRMLLSDFLREELRLTGTHVGCEHGIRGACTVLVDGEAARSCLMRAVQADGAELLTTEVHRSLALNSPRTIDGCQPLRRLALPACSQSRLRCGSSMTSTGSDQSAGDGDGRASLLPSLIGGTRGGSHVSKHQDLA